MTDDDRIDGLLRFWFDPAQRERWFDADPAFDCLVRDRFGDLLADGAAGSLDGWRDRAPPRGALALCLVLDQLPRNVWRGTARAFATDARAREVARWAIAAGLDRSLRPEERLFLYLPFEHSEDLADQERSVALFEGLGDPGWLGYAVRHRDIVRRFGRFPHRNAALGRASTAEELDFLREPLSSF